MLKNSLLDLAENSISSHELPIGNGAFQVVTLAPWQLWLASKDAGFKARIQAADATSIDGKWLALLLDFAGRRSQVVTGRGIVDHYFEAPRFAENVVVVGSSDESILALSRLRPAWVTFGGSFSEVIDAARLSEIVAAVEAQNAAVVFVALGSPKQEMWGRQIADVAGVSVVGIGGAIETVVGLRKRPSKLVQLLKIEFLQRAVQDPKRFFPRIGQALSIIPRLASESIAIRLAK